jgi:thiamine pyrophosphate-dependent acetolactate synthase large subunit-like protein
MNNGGTLLAQAIKQQGFDTFFYIMGAPMMQVEKVCMALGLRGIDVRHEQAAVMAAHAYARLQGRPGLCMAASGPGTTNMITGVAHAWADCVPLVVLGGSSAGDLSGRGGFQEVDQLKMMEPCVKWSARVHQADRMPEMLDKAVRIAMSGKPGPVYLDLPADILLAEVAAENVWFPKPFNPAERPRPCMSKTEIAQMISLLQNAERPVIVSGSGALWSEASAEFQAFVEATGIPFYTTPQGRGIVAEDHELCLLNARSTAFREADLVLVLGTRMNYIVSHIAPPRFREDVRIVRIDIDPQEIAESQRLEQGIVADLKTALAQLIPSVRDKSLKQRFAPWLAHLTQINQKKSAQAESRLNVDTAPIHPLRLCKEIRDFMDRDAILCVDGQEILTFGRQVIPTFFPNHRINSGTFGTMGVGMPFGVGAKAAAPDKQVIVLHGDGSFGMNVMEFDTAVRHKLPVIVVISLNGGWTADPDKVKPGRDLGYTRFDTVAQGLGGHGELVETPDQIRPALERAAAAVAKGQPALINVVTDANAKSSSVEFTRYVT